MTAKELMIGCEHDGSYIPVGEVERLMKEYAHLKCLEAIKNVRHKACDIITEKHSYQIDEDNLPFILKSIHNIPNQDVMPEL